jgi:hypothetical protein
MFEKGDRVKLTAAAVRCGLGTKELAGTVVGRSRDGDPRLRWDGQKKVNVLESAWLEPSDESIEAASRRRLAALTPIVRSLVEGARELECLCPGTATPVYGAVINICRVAGLDPNDFFGRRPVDPEAHLDRDRDVITGS